MTAPRPHSFIVVVTLASFLLASLPVPAAVPAGPAGGRLAHHAAEDDARTGGPRTSAAPDASASGWDLTLYDGSRVTVRRDRLGAIKDTHGRSRPFTVLPQAGRSAMGDTWSPDRRELVRRASLPQRGAYAPGEILVALADSSAGVAADR